MIKTSILLFVLVGLLLVVTSCGQSQPAETPPSHEHEKATFQVEVSRNGFNNMPGEFQLEVEAGQEVEITFVYGDGDFPQDNPHVIAIPGYGIEDVVLDKDNPEKTVSFTAGAGEVVFKCTTITCVGHTNLQRGLIVPQEHSH